MASRIWGGCENWHFDASLQAAAEEAKLDWSALDHVERECADTLNAAIAANEAAQDASGHWGVPLMVFEGEPFFGQDRIAALLWRMRQYGLTVGTASGPSDRAVEAAPAGHGSAQ